jgi:hypothetical protein
MWTDDPAMDALNYDMERQAELDKCPKCAYCDRPIQDEKCLLVNDELYHTDCFLAEHQVDTDDYIE